MMMCVFVVAFFINSMNGASNLPLGIIFRGLEVVSVVDQSEIKLSKPIPDNVRSELLKAVNEYVEGNPRRITETIIKNGYTIITKETEKEYLLCKSKISENEKHLLRAENELKQLKESNKSELERQTKSFLKIKNEFEQKVLLCEGQIKNLQTENLTLSSQLYAFTRGVGQTVQPNTNAKAPGQVDNDDDFWQKDGQKAFKKVKDKNAELLKQIPFLQNELTELRDLKGKNVTLIEGLNYRITELETQLKNANALSGVSSEAEKEIARLQGENSNLTAVLNSKELPFQDLNSKYDNVVKLLGNAEKQPVSLSKAEAPVNATGHNYFRNLSLIVGLFGLAFFLKVKFFT